MKIKLTFGVVAALLLSSNIKGQEIPHEKPRCSAIVTICEAVRDKPVAILNLVHAGFAVTDGYYTNRDVHRGGIERDPIAKTLLGQNPTWPRMVPMGAAWLIGEDYIAEKMRRSSNHVVRKLWFVPQVLGIASSAFGAIYSSRMQ